MKNSPPLVTALLRAAYPAFRPLAWLFGCGYCLIAAASCSVIVNTSDREACASSTECTARFGEPSACVNATCTKLLTAECTEVYPANALSQDNVLLVGFMGALSGGPDDYGVPTKEGAEVALHEIEAAVNGLPAPTGSTVVRHLAMLVCDHGSDPVRVARHLIEDANVPVIIGASYSTPTLKLFKGVAHAAQVLVLSPSATSPAITDEADDGFLWRTSPSDTMQAEMMKFLVADVDKVLHDSGVLEAGQKPKIAMPTKDDSAGTGLANAARSVNADSPHPAPKVDPGLNDVYPDPDTKTVNWQPYIQNILDYAPHIIVAMGTSEFATSMMPAIESNWKTSKYRPWYVLPEGDRFKGLADLVALSPKSGLNQRIIGTAPGARRSSLYTGFKASFEGTLQHPPGNLAEFGYDAAYLVAYAIAIADQAVPNGVELRDAMKLMSCHDATKVPAGPDRFGFYFRQAQMDKCIDFDGASGPLDFNPDTGEALSDIGMWCVRSSNNDQSFGFDPPLDAYYSVENLAVVDGDPPLDLSSGNWCAPAAED